MAKTEACIEHCEPGNQLSNHWQAHPFYDSVEADHYPFPTIYKIALVKKSLTKNREKNTFCDRM